MAASAWLPLPNADSRALTEARMQAHYAVQWLARAARAFIPAKPDDSHTNLGWDHEFAGLVTHPLPGNGRLGLRISDLALAVLDGKPEYFSLDGKRNADAHSWLSARLSAAGLESAKLDTPLPYELPAHPLAGNAAYRVSAELPLLAAWFANSDRSLNGIRENHAKTFNVSAVRCWPHHFDIATLISLDAGGGEHARSVGAGLSPGDSAYEEPYFYVTPWPYPDAAKLPATPKPGHWHTQGFTALVLPASKTSGQQESESFLAAAVTISLKLLA